MLGTRLRYDVGHRVRCRVGPIEWAAGRIVGCDYREDDWPDGETVPYQVELDDGALIYAPADSDGLIRSEAEFERHIYNEEQQAELEQQRYREETAARYPRKHPALFEPSELPRFLAPKLKEALRAGDDALRALFTEEAPGLYSLRIFTDELCTMLLEECEHFEAWCEEEGITLHRPNTMNNHGAILDDFGMDRMMDAVMRQCVQPLATLVGFADVVGSAGLRTHHAFLVSYAMGKDLDLSFHVDSSDVTLNVCLGKKFEGGALFFRGVRCRAHQQTGAAPHETVAYAHRPGVALLHRGHHRHGAHAITSGERHNLILWCRGDPSKGSSEGANARRAECQKWCWLHADAH